MPALRQPDLHVVDGALPFTWEVLLQVNDAALNVTYSLVTCTVYNNGVAIDSLALELLDPENGHIAITVDEDLFSALGVYSTWMLREVGALDTWVAQGRIVKNRMHAGVDWAHLEPFVINVKDKSRPAPIDERFGRSPWGLFPWPAPQPTTSPCGTAPYGLAAWEQAA